MKTDKYVSVLFVMLCSIPLCLAQDEVVIAWETNGVLTAGGMAPGSMGSVEWASSLDKSFSGLPIQFAFVADSNGTMHLEVPMFFRVLVSTNAPLGMVRIPAGICNGTNPLAKGEISDFYHPDTYSLTVDAFYMDQYEVTKAVWDTVYHWAILNGYAFDGTGDGKNVNHPVYNINWYDCVKWCNARSEMTGARRVTRFQIWFIKPEKFKRTAIWMPAVIDFQPIQNGNMQRTPEGNLGGSRVHRRVMLFHMIRQTIVAQLISCMT